MIKEIFLKIVAKLKEYGYLKTNIDVDSIISIHGIFVFALYFNLDQTKDALSGLLTTLRLVMPADQILVTKIPTKKLKISSIVLLQVINYIISTDKNNYSRNGRR